MSDATTNDAAEPAADERDKKRRGGMWLLLLILLLLAAGAAYYFFFTKTPPAPDGSFRTGQFQGCDSNGNCGTFVVYAPGFEYAWAFDKASVVELPPGRTPFAQKVGDDIKSAEGVVVTGLASREGGEDFNRWLAACRANAFQSIVAKIQGRVGGEATIYRASLGRYDPEGAAEWALDADGGDTQIERLMIMAFIIETDPNIDLSEALRDGILKNVEPALADQLPQVAEQLDFANYSCWGEAFELTTIGGRMGRSCYPEPSSCSVFTQ